MERKIPSSVGDFLAVVMRRKYWIIVPFCFVIAIAIVVTPRIPRTYQSTATVMLVPQKVSTAYVRSITPSDMANRIQRIQLKVMSGPGLVQIIKTNDLYPKLRAVAKMPQVVAAMSRDISIEAVPDSSDGHGGVNAFMISYIGRTPMEAQTVTNQLADLYIQENLREGRQDAQGAVSFLASQVAQAGQQLAAQQQKVQAFKTSHLSSLPEGVAANLQMIGQYQANLQANRAAIDQDNQRRVYLESVLNVKPGGGGKNGTATPVPPSPLEIQLAQDQAQLRADLQKYTADYPDVVRLKREIAALEVQIRQAPKSKSPIVAVMPITSGPTQNDQLRGELIALNADIASRRQRQQEMEQKLGALQANASVTPTVQTEFAALDSTYQEMQRNYNVLLGKQQEAAMAAALDQNDGSAQFTLIKPAGLPHQPFRPKPLMIYMGSVIAGALLGFMCALIMELRDDTMHTTDEVAGYLKLPVIAGLPQCRRLSGKPRKAAAFRS